MGVDRTGRPEAELTVPSGALPQPVEQYLTELTVQIADGLGPQLLGLYLTGSAALDAFDPRSSDLDVVGICSDTVPIAARQSLIPRLRHVALPCPARGLELVVYPLTCVQAGTADPGFVLELNDGPSMPFSAAVDSAERPPESGDFWYVVDRSILRSAGRPLLGPPVEELVQEPSRPDVLQALAASVDWHRAAGTDQSRNAVLNACRAWCWATMGTWRSKPAAGRWALAHGGPDVRSVVRAAVEGRPLDPVPTARVLDEVLDVLRRAATAT